MDTHGHGGEARPVEIRVNRQPVKILGHSATGLQIKDAAIKQGVKIQPDFVLSGRIDGKPRVIGDDDRVELREGEEFSAVAPDDNS